MNPTLLATLIVLAGGLVLTIGDLFMLKWTTTSVWKIYAIGLMFYFIGDNLLAQSFRFESPAVASIALVVFNVITLALVSWIVFHVPLSKGQIAGIVLGICAVIMMQIS